MNTRIATGNAVQISSTVVLWTSVTSATAPFDFRKVTIE